MQRIYSFPLYAKVSIILLGIFVFVAILILAQGIIVPLLFAIIFAIALSPVVNFLVKKRFSRVLAISITLSVAIVIVLMIIVLLSSQMLSFVDSFPKLILKFQKMSDDLVQWISTYLNIGTVEIDHWIGTKTAEALKNSSTFIGQTIVGTGNILVGLVLIPVYIFLVLYYQPLLLNFIHKLFASTNSDKVAEVIASSKSIIQSYLVGLLLEALIVAVLNSASLLIIGIDYAILLGVLGALLNVVPYIGGLIAAALCLIVTLATKSPSYALLVLAVFMFIQLVDNNFIMPKIVASRVKINALVSIIIVIIGGAIWGVAGMFIAIPMTAIVKVVFDHVTPLKPWGYLLGDTF
ncbi:MAG: AI-2E family transporter [Bacteroidetes bacterium]|nr:AI-2E family transporter [Bacteroidota bacterium]